MYFEAYPRNQIATHTDHIHAQMLTLFTSKTLNSFCICTMINTKEIATDASNAIQMESKTNEIACNLPDTRPAHFFFILNSFERIVENTNLSHAWNTSCHCHRKLCQNCAIKQLWFMILIWITNRIISIWKFPSV